TAAGPGRTGVPGAAGPVMPRSRRARTGAAAAYEEQHVAESVVTEGEGGDATRRDFIHIAAGAAAVGAGAMAVWPLINQMNPAADTLALASIEFDLSKVQEGQQVVIKWQGKPVFVRYRTPREIQEAEATPLSALKDPQTDAERVKEGHQQYLVVLGNCTHLGCVPTFGSGDFGGWF